jgi:hypothetical protein
MIHRQLFDAAPAGMLAVRDGFIQAPECAGLGIDLAEYAPW